MTVEYYVLYDKQSLIPNSVSCNPFASVPEGQATVKINERHGAHILTGAGHMEDHFVNILDNGEAELRYRLTEFVSRRKVQADNVVQDLDYKVVLIDLFNIRFTHVDNHLTLNFDITALTPEHYQLFCNSITNNQSVFNLYITEYGSDVLITKFKFDLLQLSKDGTLTLPLIIDKRISVWACR